MVAPANAAAATTAFGTRTLKVGMHGRDVRTAQVLLRRVGNQLTIDNDFGPRTRSAVESWERTTGRPVDGRLERQEAPLLRADADKAVQERRAAQLRASQQGDPATDPAAATGTTDATATPTDPASGGASPTDPVGVAGEKAVLNADGTATAPASAPEAVKQIIAAGNEIAKKPYIYGGGHGRWKDSGYDCSGSVSYALHGAGLLDEAMPSGSFESWGEPGKGEWVTLYANGGHIFMVVAGLRFDTSGADPSRWQEDMRSSRGYVVRHPAGL